jgi:hypothetical protein
MRSAVWLFAALATGSFASETAAAAQTAAPSPESLGDFLKPGDKVASFEAAGIDGVMRRVEFPKKTATVLMFFSSGCPHCHHMIPLWNERYQRRPPNVAMIGIIVDKEPPGFFEHISILFPVLRMPSRSMLTDFKVARVPLMLRIAPGGVVEEVGVGILDPIRLGQILRP